MEMRYKEIPKNLIENNENKENDVYARHDFDEFDKIFCMQAKIIYECIINKSSFGCFMLTMIGI